MSTNRMLITLYAVLFAVAVIARAVAGPIPDLANGGKASLYAMAKAGPAQCICASDVQMAASDTPPGP